jgi:ribosomal protein L35
MLEHKSAKRKRLFAGTKAVTSCDAKKILRNAPYLKG